MSFQRTCNIGARPLTKIYHEVPLLNTVTITITMIVIIATTIAVLCSLVILELDLSYSINVAGAWLVGRLIKKGASCDEFCPVETVVAALS